MAFTIAVTGSAGRIGRSISHKARHNGYKVISLDLLNDAHPVVSDVRDTDPESVPQLSHAPCDLSPIERASRLVINLRRFAWP